MALKAASKTDFPQLFDIQLTCIKELVGVYQQHEVDAWIEYLEQETSRRFMRVNSAYWENDAGERVSFASWVPGNELVKIEALYTLPDHENNGYATRLLEHVETALRGRVFKVRSTLNAVDFYKARGYSFVSHDMARAGFKIALLEKLPH